MNIQSIPLADTHQEGERKPISLLTKFKTSESVIEKSDSDSNSNSDLRSTIDLKRIMDTINFASPENLIEDG